MHAHINQIRLNQTSDHYSYTFCAPHLGPNMPWLLHQIRLNQTSDHYSYTFCAPQRRLAAASWFNTSVGHRPLSTNSECKGTPEHSPKHAATWHLFGAGFEFLVFDFLVHGQPANIEQRLLLTWARGGQGRPCATQRWTQPS